MYQKLSDLGWVCYNDEIHTVEPETEESQYHVNRSGQERNIDLITFQEASLLDQNNNLSNPP